MANRIVLNTISYHGNYPGLSSYSLEFLRSKFPVPDNFPGQPHRAAYDADVTFSLFSMAMNILCGNPSQNE